MMKPKFTGRKIAICGLSVLMAGSLAAGQLAVLGGSGKEADPTATSTAGVTDVTGRVGVDASQMYDESVVQKLPEGLSGDREISVIVNTTDKTLLKAFTAQSGRYSSFDAFADSAEGGRIAAEISSANEAALGRIRNAGVKFTRGADYDTVMGGFELVVKAKEFEKISAALAGTSASAYISEEYAPSEAQLVTNDVNVYGTGIFDSSASAYDGTGTVVAVLDTGLDYTHSVFDPAVFRTDFDLSRVGMKREDLDGVMGDLVASQETADLTAAKVYVNEKVPYAYDYADHDADVYPHGDGHGTHVAGVILGDNRNSALNLPGDPEIVGVAPKAQVAVMKVFSDVDAGARWSWIVSALEDCVHLGVDVINMSLGAGAGFSEEADEKQAYVYEMVEEAGISLVTAASNDYSSSYNSEKNGNLGLTTNPDTGNVGSPSTFKNSLSVASISGVKTAYLLFENTIMYFTESSDAAAEPKDFVKELFDAIGPSMNELEIEYVTVPGIGRSADYQNIDVNGKIALVCRGSNTFEEKARIAMRNGAIGVIIYNNVSGDIRMTVGNLSKDGKPFPVCSISQDNGEMLSKYTDANGNKTMRPGGKIKISRDQVAGPFMSDFSSWGPTPDLRIKPEITAHGGDILSSVPGQRYDRLSGTSMASPNQAGVTALVRQYVKENAAKFRITAQEGTPEYARAVSAAVYSLLMSTADIAKNTNGLPYSVRKQGSGLANLAEATSSPAFISTFERDDAGLYDGTRYTDEVMDRAKIEVGDDPEKTGVYELKFNINNTSSSALSYDVDAIVMTEGIAETLTYKGDRTVTEEGYPLEGANVSVDTVSGDGSANGNIVTVDAGGTLTVTVYVRLGESDLAYLDQIDQNKNTPVFANGMFVEGYVTLAASNGTTISLNVPFLAFYGNWMQAPMFDLDYFDTDADANDPSFDLSGTPLERTLPDIFATLPIGSLEDDYINYLGSYYFLQDPTSSIISAQREHIALSNDPQSVSGIYGVYAGLLRGAKEMRITITDTVTGEVVWQKVEYNQRKSVQGGSPSLVDVDFDMAEAHLKENTQYVFRLEGVMDYGDGGLDTNLKNTFEFPFMVDSQAPVLTDVEYTVEYDRASRRNRLYARLHVYDNHYSMAMYSGVATKNAPGSQYEYTINNFTRLPTPIYSEFNSTSVVVFELTDYLDEIRNGDRENCFYISLYDYAMNSSSFEISLPDDITMAYFTENDRIVYEKDEAGNAVGTPSITLNPNETYALEPSVYPDGAWRETLQYVSTDETVVRIVDGKLFAVPTDTEANPGTRTASVKLYARADAKREHVLATLDVRVLGPQSNEEGFTYRPFDAPVADSFRLTGYHVDNAFYFAVSSDRDIGMTGDTVNFSANSTSYAVTMYPSEQISVLWDMAAYFPDVTEVTFESANTRVATVNEAGQITAQGEGNTSISVSVRKNGQSTLYNVSVSISVKNPYERNGPYLLGWRGMPDAEGTVTIDPSLGFTEIYEYAFSHYHSVPKDPWDEISEEDPYFSKTWYLGENQHVKKVVIPEGVETIGMYAFAGMEGLEEVVLPSTLNKISAGAFRGCTNLKRINLENVQFIGQDAFAPGIVRDEDDLFAGYTAGVPLEQFAFTDASGNGSIIAIGDRAFQNVRTASKLVLPESAQSIGTQAFANATALVTLSINASTVKFGAGAFENCSLLVSVGNINAAVIPDDLFNGCRNLSSVTLGASVETIGANAFAGTRVAKFTVNSGNTHYKTAQGNSAILLSNDGSELTMIAPGATAADATLTLDGVTKVGKSAFANNSVYRTVKLPDVTEVDDYAFRGSAVTSFTFGQLTRIGDYAFAQTNLTLQFATAVLGGDGLQIGAYAFFGAFSQGKIDLTLGNNVAVGDYAFAQNAGLRSVTVGENARLGAGAFVSAHSYEPIESFNVRYSDGTTSLWVKMGYTGTNNLQRVTLGEGAEIGDYAFAYNMGLNQLTLGADARIGNSAFELCTALSSVDLSEAKTIGARAFAGFGTPLIDGEDYERAEFYEEPQSNSIATIDLSNAEYVGAYAFAFNTKLTSVHLGDAITAIGSYAFFGTPVSTVNLDKIETIGDGAFGTMITEGFFIDSATGETEKPFIYGFTGEEVALPAATEIGADAFGNAQRLVRVTLSEDPVHIGARAFANLTTLTEVVNLGHAEVIGAQAFFNTSLNGVLDLTGAREIGDFAFGYLNSYVDEETGLTIPVPGTTSDTIKGATFSEDLAVLGENPFSGRELPLFSKTEQIFFNGISVGTKNVYTFDVSENVKVIDGVLYKRVPAGYTLVTYPLASEAETFAVADGVYTFYGVDENGNQTVRTEEVEVVRIAARAFQGTHVERVEFPLYVGAIGDMAFYGAKDLKVVVFKSLNAPILEETYDEDYMLVRNLAGPNISFEGRETLGIVKYLMWGPLFFFGANFEDRIGLNSGDIVMVRPVNGVGYDSFVYEQYFGSTFDGAVAFEDVTLAAYKAIAALIDAADISEENVEEVAVSVRAARALYDAISSEAQRALVTNYSRLTSAESIINFLSPTTPVGPDNPPAGPTETNGEHATVIALGVVCGVLGALLIAGGVVFFLRRKRG